MAKEEKILLKIGIEENVYQNKDRADILYGNSDYGRNYKIGNFYEDSRAELLYNHPDNERETNQLEQVYGLGEKSLNIEKRKRTTRLESDKKRKPQIIKIAPNKVKFSEKLDYINSKREGKTPSFNLSIEVQNPATIENTNLDINSIVKRPRRKSLEEIAEIFYPNMGEEKSQIKVTPKKQYNQEFLQNANNIQQKMPDISNSEKMFFPEGTIADMKPKTLKELEETNSVVVNSVKYPLNSGNQTVETMTMQAQKVLSDIEKERLLEHLKNIGGFSLEVGSAFIPLSKEAKIVGILSKTVAPKVGNLIANEIATSAIKGATSGAVFGLGEGLLNDDSSFKSTLEGAVLGFVMGVGFGYASGQIGKSVSAQNIINASDKKVLLDEYYKNYVEGLSNKTEDLHKYRALVNNIDNIGKIEVLYDKINRTGIKPIFIEKEESANLLSELNTNLPASLRKRKVIDWTVGNYQYKIINNGFNEYVIIQRRLI